MPKLAEHNERTRWLRAHELADIRAQLTSEDDQWLDAIVAFAPKTGMRFSTLCGLKAGDYQEDDAGRAVLVTDRTKNGDRLVWPLEGESLALIKRQCGKAPSPDSPLFPGPDGGNAHSSVRRALPDAVRAAGLKWGRKHKEGVTFHTFRHSMASLALNAGIPEHEVQRMGNWRDRRMVGRYAHLADSNLRGAVAKLDAIVDGRDGHAVVTIRSTGPDGVTTRRIQTTEK